MFLTWFVLDVCFNEGIENWLRSMIPVSNVSQSAMWNCDEIWSAWFWNFTSPDQYFYISPCCCLFDWLIFLIIIWVCWPFTRYKCARQGNNSKYKTWFWKMRSPGRLNTKNYKQNIKVNTGNQKRNKYYS